MDLKIMWAALVFLGGWLWFYFILRQLIFNLATALPMLNRFKKAGGEKLMSVNAKRFLSISIIIWFVISAGVCYLVIHFAPPYLYISFLIGGVVGALLHIKHYGPDTKANYNDFCSTYYRFVPDDVLRTAMYNNKLSEMKARLAELEVNKKLVIPEFKRDK